MHLGKSDRLDLGLIVVAERSMLSSRDPGSFLCDAAWPDATTAVVDRGAYLTRGVPHPCLARVGEFPKTFQVGTARLHSSR